MNNENKWYMQGGEKEKQEKPVPRQDPVPERRKDYTEDRPLRESEELPDLIEPEQDWDKE